MTSDEDRKRILALARGAITAHAAGSSSLPIEPGDALLNRCGAFVTLHEGTKLRGCIGHVHADKPLWQVIMDCAVAASSRDPRFSAVTSEEVPRLTIEVSLLGPLERVAALDEIDIGRHGLVVERAWHRGLLLPQVATEWKWDRREFVAQTCLKAGLPPDAWEHGATIWKFEAEVFSETG